MNNKIKNTEKNQSNQNNQATLTLFLWQIASALIGVSASLYLLIHHTRLKTGIQDSASFCSLGGLVDCDVVNASSYSELFGIPIAGLGAFFFFTLLVMGILAPPKDKTFGFCQKIMAWLCLVALAYDVILLVVVQIFLIKTFCLMCFMVYVATGLHLFFNLKMARLPKQSWTDCAKGHLLVKPEIEFKLFSTQKLIFAGVSLIALTAMTALLPYFIKQKSATYTHADNTIEQFYVEWKDKPIKRIEVKPTDGVFGNLQSKIQIVEFSDFECPFCRRAAFTLHTFLKPLEKKILFVFKHFPLDSTCNPGLPYQLHAHACKLARLTVCAGQKGKFWDLHDTLFLDMTDDHMKEGFDAISERMKKVLSTEEIAACLSNPKSLESISQDIKLGNDMNIRGTPTIFINGKQVTIPLTIETLNKLIEIESSLNP